MLDATISLGNVHANAADGAAIRKKYSTMTNIRKPFVASLRVATNTWYMENPTEDTMEKTNSDIQN